MLWVLKGTTVSLEPSQWDSSLSTPKNVKIDDKKKTNTILCSKVLFIRSCEDLKIYEVPIRFLDRLQSDWSKSTKLKFTAQIINYANNHAMVKVDFLRIRFVWYSFKFTGAALSYVHNQLILNQSIFNCYKLL